MKVSQYILENRKRLAEAPIECADPLEHMKQIVQFVLDWDSAQVYLKWDDHFPPGDAVVRLDEVVSRRLRGEPFQYITGFQWFWKSKFEVGKGVLIPRRETELLVETFLAEEKRDNVNIAELGAGSGNIGLAICLERPHVQWHAFESNPDSLTYLEANLRTLIPGTSATTPYWVHYDDFFSRVGEYAPFHWVIANPPYVVGSEISNLSLEVQSEPIAALDGGGNEGLEIFTRLVATSWDILLPGGKVLCEIGSAQADAALALTAQAGFSEIKLLADLAGLPRAIFAVKPQPKEE